MFPVHVLKTEAVQAASIDDLILEGGIFFCACLHSSLEGTLVLHFSLILTTVEQISKQNCNYVLLAVPLLQFLNFSFKILNMTSAGTNQGKVCSMLIW